MVRTVYKAPLQYLREGDILLRDVGVGLETKTPFGETSSCLMIGKMRQRSRPLRRKGTGYSHD